MSGFAVTLDLLLLFLVYVKNKRKMKEVKRIENKEYHIINEKNKVIKNNIKNVPL